MHRFQKKPTGGEYSFPLVAKMIPATLGFVTNLEKLVNDICYQLLLESPFLLYLGLYYFFTSILNPQIQEKKKQHFIQF